MRRVTLLLPLVVGLFACGPDMTGTWGGTISFTSTSGKSGSYSDTWTISQAQGQPSGTLQILTVNTCTKWDATQGGGVATFSTLCNPYTLAGSLQLQGGQLVVSFDMQPQSSPSGTTPPDTHFSGTLSKQ